MESNLERIIRTACHARIARVQSTLMRHDPAPPRSIARQNSVLRNDARIFHERDVAKFSKMLRSARDFLSS